LKNWDDEIHSALSNPIRRCILECLRERSALSFQELVKCVGISNHGKLGFHVRSLRGLVGRDRLIKKLRLTDRGQLAAELIWASSNRMSQSSYQQRLGLENDMNPLCGDGDKL
jgi:DNA-binding transcriptional ArsR family regulator